MTPVTPAPRARRCHGPTLFAGLAKPLDLKLVGRQEFGSGAVAMADSVMLATARAPRR